MNLFIEMTSESLCAALQCCLSTVSLASSEVTGESQTLKMHSVYVWDAGAEMSSSTTIAADNWDIDLCNLTSIPCLCMWPVFTKDRQFFLRDTNRWLGTGYYRLEAWRCLKRFSGIRYGGGASTAIRRSKRYSSFSRDMDRLVKNNYRTLSCKVEESSKKFTDQDPEADDCRNLLISSLFKDTSVVKIFTKIRSVGFTWNC